MFQSLFQDHLQGSSFALSADHASVARFVICLYCVCGRMPSVCICSQCTCLCAVWSCKALKYSCVVVALIENYSTSEPLKASP
jgi:hypothetical protein